MTATLIGLTGKKRSGKDSCAARLVERHGFARVAFADPLKEACLGLDPIIRIQHDEAAPLRDAGARWLSAGDLIRLAPLVSTVGWEAAKAVQEVRRTLQHLGVAIRDLQPDFWLAQALTKVETLLSEGTSVAITDVRFPNELAGVLSIGGFHVHVDRPGIDTSDPHQSETALEPFYGDAHVEVLNHGTIEDLNSSVDALTRLLGGAG